MNIPSLITSKVKEYTQHCIIALDFYFKSDFEHTLGDFRKSGEALMKILILQKFGDSNGENIILGLIDRELNSISPQKRMEYQDLLDLLKSEKLMPSFDFGRLLDIQKKSNPSAHNPNAPINFEEGAHLCKSQSLALTQLLFKKLNTDIPKELSNAYNNQISSAMVASLMQSDWNDFFEFTDGFSNQNTFILVAPPRFEECTQNQLEIISRISWSFVIDFDPDSKENGLYKSFENKIGSGFLPITIKQKGIKGLISSGSYGSVNWLFANGLKTISDTTTTTIKNWRSAKYHQFIKELFSEFFSKTIRRYVIVYLWDDLSYIEEITRVISEIDEIPNDLVKHIFLSTDSDKRDKIQEFDKFDIQFKAFNLSVQSFISKISDVLTKNETETDKILVPARTKLEEHAFIDISDIYNKLLADHITVVYQNIEHNTQDTEDKKTPPFYQGEQITWKDLSIDIEAKRNKYKELHSKLLGHLQTTKKSIKFDLLHKPGGGGTTLAHRVAFDLRDQFPVISITKFDKSKTYKSILLILERVNRPILALVEASNVGLNDVEDLIRICNSNKLVVCFLYVRRTLKIDKSNEFSTYVNDSMADITERNKFLAKANLYTQDKTSLTHLEEKHAIESEVIDFALAINEKDYNTSKLAEYINYYLEKMKEDEVRFMVFTCLIYYYSQKSVSELIFRSLFKKSLSEELRKTAYPNQHIRKILIQEYDQEKQEYTEYWRPRFSKFAETVLSVVLGGNKDGNWKDQIDLYSKELISIIKENNEHLIDETRTMLKSVFFERNNEDLLGTEEQWRSNVSNDQFSFLIRDIGIKQKQKSVLMNLVEAYPRESHFLGHLARFYYEKAEEVGEFIQAEEYIQQALDCPDGDADYNLQHLGGMCKRRHIEFLNRNYETGKPTDLTGTELIELCNDANVYFDRSRSINPYNIHAYVAQIQTLILTIDFGKKLSGIEKKENFITNTDYSWYLEQYHTVKKLIDEAQILVEQQESLGKTNKIEKAKYYISQSEGRSYELLGNYSTSIEMFKRLIESSDRVYRPQIRIMYIYSILLNKVKGNSKKLKDAWYKLRDEEIQNIEKALNDNILQDPSSIISLRLWFKMVRYSSVNIPLEEVISRLKLWLDNSEASKILNLEASYYLYVLNAALTIKAGDSFSSVYKNEAIHYINRCRELSRNNKYAFEWLSKEGGIDSIINHNDKTFGDDSILERVEGTITVISSRQQGKITLKSGMEAFFVPTVGNFIEGKDETSSVAFLVGFRHDGLVAIDVRRVNNQKAFEVVTKNTEEELQQEVAIPMVENIESIEEETIPKREYVISGPKIVGAIDLSKFDQKTDRYKQKRK